jgi:hypothetical protein
MSYSKYPQSIDDSSTLPLSTDNVTPVKSEVVNRLQNAVIAVETELGTNPSGTYGTVTSRLQAISQAVGIGAQPSASFIRWDPSKPSSGLTFQTWAEVIATIPNSPGGFDCLIDTSSGTPAIIPSGTYDTQGLITLRPYRDGTTIGVGSYPAVTVQFAQGALVKNLRAVDGSIELSRTGTNVILSWDLVNPGNTSPIFRIENGATLIDSGLGPGPMISVPNNQLLAIFASGYITNFISGGGPVINLGTNSILLMICTDGVTLSNNWITSTDSTAQILYEIDGKTHLPTTSGFTGTISYQEIFRPYWSTANRPGSKVGVIGYNTDNNIIEFNTGSAWKSLITTAGDIGGTGPSPTITGLQNIPISASPPSIGNVLEYNGTYWIPGVGFTAGGDLSGSSTSQTVISLQSKSVATTAPTANQNLAWNSSTSKWTPTDRLAPIKLIFPGVAGLQQTTNTTPTEIGASLFDPTSIYSGSAYTIAIKIIAELEVNTAGESAVLVLYDITNGVTISTLTGTTTTPAVYSQVLTVSSAGTNTIANSSALYGWRLSRSGATSSDPVTCKMAHFEVKYS